MKGQGVVRRKRLHREAGRPGEGGARTAGIQGGLFREAGPLRAGTRRVNART